MTKMKLGLGLVGLAVFGLLVSGCDDTRAAAADRARDAEREAREELAEAKQELIEAKQEIRRLDAALKAKAESLAKRTNAEINEAATEAKEDLEAGARALERKVDEADEAVGRAIRSDDEQPQK